MPSLYTTTRPLTLALSLVLGVLFAFAPTADAQIARDFSKRFSANVTGDFAYAANTSLTCDNDADPTNGSLDGSGSQAERECERVLLGANPTPIRNEEPRNNRFFLRNLDVDNVSTTFNSSSSQLDLPAGSSIIWAGLYWGTRSSGEQLRNFPNNGAGLANVKFDLPSSTGYSYVSVDAQQSDDDGYTKGYFAEVTALVQQGGSGIYTVADVDAVQKENGWAAWTLVVAYEDPNEPFRNLSVFDGSGQVTSNGNPREITVKPNGFTTPLSGSFNPYVGVVLYDGDKGKPGQGQGDFFAVNGTKLSNAANPIDDFGNATISMFGSQPVNNLPAYENNFSTDVDVLFARDGSGNNLLGNGDTGADVTISSAPGEGISIQLLTFASEIYEPDVTITKTLRDLNGGKPEPGDVLEYTMVVTNEADQATPDDAQNVILTDAIPAFTTYKPGSLVIVTGSNVGAKSDAAGNDQAEYDASDDEVVFRLGNGANGTQGGTLSANASTTVRFQVTVDAGVSEGTTIFNQALVGYRKATLGTTDIVSGSNSATTTVGKGTDLSITKTDNVDPVRPGQQVTYTIVATNNGPDAAKGALVSDQLPAGLSYVSSTAPAGWATMQSGQSVTFLKSADFANNGTASFTITAAVTAADGAVLTNTASISSNTPETNSGNNRATETTNVKAPIDLSTTVTVDESTPNVGDLVEFTVTIANASGTATGVEGQFVLPAGLVYVSDDGGNTTDQAGQTVSINGGTLATGGSKVVKVVARVTDAGPLKAVAQVTAANEDDIDSTPANDDGDQSEDDEAFAIVTGQQADLSLSKIASSATTVVGDDVTFTLRITNDGPSDATGVQVTDKLPTGLAYLSNNGGGSYNANTGVWNVGSVASGTSKVLKIKARVTKAGANTNSAEVTASDQPDPDSTPGNDDASEDDQASATVGGTQIDLSLTNVVADGTIKRGETTTFTVTVRNDGSADATGVSVADAIPAGLTVIGSNAGQGSFGGGDWTVGNLAIGESATLTVEVRADADGSFDSIAQVSAANEPDVDSAPGNDDGDQSEDDEAKATVVVTPVIDLEVEVSASATNVNVGDNVTLFIDVSNVGPSDGTGIASTIQLPPGLAFVSDNGNGSYDPTTGIFTIGDLDAGDDTRLEIVVRVEQPGALTPVAEITAADQDDIDSTPGNGIASEDDQDDVTIGGVQIDLEVTNEVVGTTTPNLGDDVTFRVTLENAGASNATGVTLTDLLPPGLTFVSANPSVGTYDEATGIWTVGDIGMGQTVTLDIVATASVPGPQSTTAQVATANEPDVDSTPGNDVATEDDQDTAGITVVAADLRLTKSVDNASPSVGEEIVYSIVVTNDGPSSGNRRSSHGRASGWTDVRRCQRVERQLHFARTQWTLGSLAVGASATLHLRATVTAPGSLTNKAEITASDQPDPDSTPGNDDPNEDDQDGAAIIAVQPADLSLAKYASDPAPTVGDDVTFSLALTNSGPGSATGVVVQDVLPVGLTFGSFVQQPGSASYDAGSRTITWNAPNLAYAGSDVTETLTYVAKVDSAKALVNLAQVTKSDQPDPDSAPGNDDGDQSEDDEARAVTTGGNASGGGNAGVESDGSMATLLAQRLFSRRQDIAARASIMAAPFAQPFGSTSGKGAGTLADLVPARGPAGTNALDVTPADLLGVTNARDVVAADYVRPDGRRIGAMFGALSPGGVLYDHAKATCDRLGGGRMESVQMLDVDGQQFVLSQFAHADGSVDFAASFVAYRMPDGYVVESRFAPNQYDVPAGALSVVNLQVWSVAPVFTAEMVRGVLAELAADAPVTFRKGARAPAVYVVDGAYANGTIALRVRNTTGETVTVNVTGSVSRSESGVAQRSNVTQTLTIPAPADGSAYATAKLDVGPIFDGSFTIDDVRSGDQFYFADGTWSFTAGPGTTVDRFETTAAPDMGEPGGTYAVERAATLTGRQGEFASLFRYLRSGGQPVDLTDFDGVEITASASGRVQIALEKVSITDWAQQFVATADLVAGQTIQIPLSQFARIGGAQGSLDASDVTLIAFYPLASQGEQFEIAIERVAFVGGTLTSIADGSAPQTLTLASAPNPARDQATLFYGLPTASNVRLEVFDMLGRSVAVLVDEMRPAGTHSAPLAAHALAAGTYVYRLATDQGVKTNTLTVAR